MISKRKYHGGIISESIMEELSAITNRSPTASKVTVPNETSRPGSIDLTAFTIELAQKPLSKDKGNQTITNQRKPDLIW